MLSSIAVATIENAKLMQVDTIGANMHNFGAAIRCVSDNLQHFDAKQLSGGLRHVVDRTGFACEEAGSFIVPHTPAGIISTDRSIF